MMVRRECKKCFEINLFINKVKFLNRPEIHKVKVAIGAVAI
jgi:hypothetical protein